MRSAGSSSEGAAPDASLPTQGASAGPQATAPRIRPTEAVIDLGALAHNLRAVRLGSPRTAVLAMVKADAYGHGALPVARLLERQGVEMFGVALVEEGVALRRGGVKLPILVLGGGYESAPEELVEAGLTPVLYRADQVPAFEAAAARADSWLPIHLEIETGMGRTGVAPEELPELLRALGEARHLEVEGVFSHFANADLADQAMNRLQVERFRGALQQVEQAGFRPAWRHLANSAGVLGLPGAHDGDLCNMVRPGIMLYGEPPTARLADAAHLEPVLTWRTAITHLKWVEAGTPISYGGRWVAPRRSRIATLPVGYADGYPRALTVGGEVLVHGRRCPIAGTVCMDMCMVDVTEVPEAALGDQVVLLGRQGGDRLAADEVAARCGTISYELLCGISARVPRRFVGEDAQP